MAGVLAEAFTEGRCALAGIKQSLRCVRKPCGGVAKAAFEGSVDDFVAANPGAEAQCYNRVKQCGHCRKVCAYTLATCNGCGADLASVAESRNCCVTPAELRGSCGTWPRPVQCRPM